MVTAAIWCAVLSVLGVALGVGKDPNDATDSDVAQVCWGMFGLIIAATIATFAVNR